MTVFNFAAHSQIEILCNSLDHINIQHSNLLTSHRLQQIQHKDLLLNCHIPLWLSHATCIEPSLSVLFSSIMVLQLAQQITSPKNCYKPYSKDNLFLATSANMSMSKPMTRAPNFSFLQLLSLCNFIYQPNRLFNNMNYSFYRIINTLFLVSLFVIHFFSLHHDWCVIQCCPCQDDFLFSLSLLPS